MLNSISNLLTSIKNRVTGWISGAWGLTQRPRAEIRSLFDKSWNWFWPRTKSWVENKTQVIRQRSAKAFRWTKAIVKVAIVLILLELILDGIKMVWPNAATIITPSWSWWMNLIFLGPALLAIVSSLFLLRFLKSPKEKKEEKTPGGGGTPPPIPPTPAVPALPAPAVVQVPKDKDKGKKSDKDKKKGVQIDWTLLISSLLILVGVNMVLVLFFPELRGWASDNREPVIAINTTFIIVGLIAILWGGWFFKSACVLAMTLICLGWFVTYTPIGKDVMSKWDKLQQLEAEQQAKTANSPKMAPQTTDQLFEQKVVPKGGKVTVNLPKGAFSVNATDHFVAVVKDSAGFELRTVQTKEGDTFLGLHSASFMECTSVNGEEITITVMN